jgi:hypothetical protein
MGPARVAISGGFQLSGGPAGFILVAGLQAFFANVYGQSNMHKYILFK